MICELVLLQIGKGDGGEGGQEGGAGVDGAVIDRIPYLSIVSAFIS